MLLLTACTFGTVVPPDLLDTGAAPEAATEEPGTPVQAAGEASLTISPDTVTEAASCGEPVPVWLTNEGDTALDLELAIAGDVTLSMEALSLEPGETAEVLVAGSEGLITLRSQAGTTTLPVSIDYLEPPELEVVAAAREIVEGPTVLEVLSDADGAWVQWDSDLEGEIGSAPVVGGWATLEWTPTLLGEHHITATVTDDCDQGAAGTQSICSDAEVVYAGFEGWELAGDAFVDGDTLTLTSDLDWEIGGAWFSTPVRADAVTVAFSFYATSSEALSADGLALVVADLQRWDGLLGPGGGGMGFGSGVEPGNGLPGWAVELDTSYNEGVDPTRDDHTAFTIDGDLAGWRASSPLPELEDGAWHRATVSVERGWLAVDVDGDRVIDALLHDDLDFAGLVGFTASTGSITSNHQVRDVQVITRACH
jgi:hypothetical protein